LRLFRITFPTTFHQDVLYELDRGLDRATEKETKAANPSGTRNRKRPKGYSGPDININNADNDGAICLSD